MLHLYLLEHGSGLILKKLLISHDSLILFWESLNRMVICLIIICLVFNICETFFWVCWILRKDWSMIIVLRYGGDNIRVMLVEVVVNLKNTCVEVCDSRSMHVWWTALWWSWSTILFIDCLPYDWRSGTSDGIFLPIYPPRSMHVIFFFDNL